MLSKLLLKWKDNYKYEIDGIICADNNIYERGNSNPEHAFAFKMIISDQIIETKVVTEIEQDSECGIYIEEFDDWQENDVISAFELIEKKRNR